MLIPFLFFASTLCLFCRHFSESNVNAIDQTWYKRAVDQYEVEPESFVYSVPFGPAAGSCASLSTQVDHDVFRDQIDP